MTFPRLNCYSHLSILTLSLPIKATVPTGCENCSQPDRSRWSSLLAAIAGNHGTMTESATKSATSSNASSTESSGIDAFSPAKKISTALHDFPALCRYSHMPRTKCQRALERSAQMTIQLCSRRPAYRVQWTGILIRRRGSVPSGGPRRQSAPFEPVWLSPSNCSITDDRSHAEGKQNGSVWSTALVDGRRGPYPSPCNPAARGGIGATAIRYGQANRRGADGIVVRSDTGPQAFPTTESRANGSVTGGRHAARG